MKIKRRKIDTVWGFFTYLLLWFLFLVVILISIYQFSFIEFDS